MKRVLILYAKYGGGHLSAANAIETYLEEHYMDSQIKVVDCVEEVTPFLSKVTTDAYKNMAKKTPKLWKSIYYKSPKGVLLKASTVAKKYLANHLLDIFNSFLPDIVISVHPFGSQITSYLKEQGKTNCKLATVFTDFKTHPQWLIGKEFNDYFFVSNDQMKQELLDLDIAEEKIHVTGIPLSNKFLFGVNPESAYKELDLDKNKKTILFFGGGEFGLGHKRTLQILKVLTNYLNEYQIVAISGKNKKLNDEFLKIQNELNNNDLKVYKYTTQVAELMSISSLVVTKPGGLTSSESLASKLPLLIINPIPGQEEENAEFLENSGAAVWLKDSDDIEGVIDGLLTNEDKLLEMKKNATAISHQKSTKDICGILMDN